MELSSLETKFFNEILNAELDVPVHATLTYRDDSLDLIVVPEITSSGYFELKYYNALAAEPEREVDASGNQVSSWQLEEALGRDPLLQRAWRNDQIVSLQLHTSPMPLQPKIDQSLSARVIYAGMQHRGSLALGDNQVIVRESQLTTTKFNLVGFPDFSAFGRQGHSGSGLDEAKRQALNSVAEGLTGGAKLTLATAPPQIILECDDGWKITVVKEESPTRDSVSHIGLIEQTDSTSYGANQLGDLLDALNYFFAFAACTYCFPTVVVGFDARNRPVWGKVARFAMDWLPPTNWFNRIGLRTGAALEELFPKFWLKWREHRDEIVAIIECYVHSFAMREAGIAKDAMAKSYTGLNLLASLQRGKEVSGSEYIKGTLSDYSVPNLSTPATDRIAKRLGGRGRRRQGPDLLDRVRGYVAHPFEKGTPVKVKQEPLKYLDREPREYLYLHDLCQFYLEYIFLAYCGVTYTDHRPLLENIQ